MRICLIAAPVIAAVMSVTSDYNRHPDEIHHFEAARYYVDHFLPPEIGDPDVRNSYSVWGVSYLNYHWIEYFLAGKFMLLATPLIGSEILAARLFNILLFAGLAGFFLYKSKDDEYALLIPSLLLITPQVWYVFSYVNNDAFPLAVSFLLVYQAAYPKSSLHRFLGRDEFRGFVRGGLGVGLLLGLMLISKTNYYAFLIFLGLWLLYKFPIVTISEARPRVSMPDLKRFALLAIVGASVLAFRCALDFYVNGETNFVAASYVNYIAGNFEKQESRLMKYQEQIAAPPFKPSTVERDLSATYPTMRLKDKGADYVDIFTRFGWHSESFKSFVGVYGYMTVYSPKWYYAVMALIYAAVFVYLMGTALGSRRPEEMVAMLVLIIGFAICLFVSSYLSWSYAFQAQGRYLFPILPMMAVFAYVVRERIDGRVWAVTVTVCFLLSLYSFVAVGMKNVDSAPVPDATVHLSGGFSGFEKRRAIAGFFGFHAVTNLQFESLAECREELPDQFRI